MNPYMQALVQQLMQQQQSLPNRQMMAPGGRMMPNTFDQMVVPPYGLPNDKNTFMPEDIMNFNPKVMPGWQEKS